MRSCRAEWFSTWPWLHYRASDDVVLCHVCITAMINKGMEKGNSESSFLFVAVFAKTFLIGTFYTLFFFSA